MNKENRMFDVLVDHSGKYADTFDWVSENIKESDCCDYLFTNNGKKIIPL